MLSEGHVAGSTQHVLRAVFAGLQLKLNLPQMDPGGHGWSAQSRGGEGDMQSWLTAATL